jgi:predicted nucleic acid-binding protein
VSFVDQVSLAVIEREAIDTLLVLDSDFARPGLTVLPPP